MNYRDALADINTLYIETAPLIYYIEENDIYVDTMSAIVEYVESSSITLFSSVLTMTEVLVHPYKLGRDDLISEYTDILSKSGRFTLLEINSTIAIRAAELRAKYNLRTPDAIHVATAIVGGCDAFLTNDAGIKRVTEIRVLVLDDLELDELSKE